MIDLRRSYDQAQLILLAEELIHLAAERWVQPVQFPKHKHFKYICIHDKDLNVLVVKEHISFVTIVKKILKFLLYIKQYFRPKKRFKFYKHVLYEDLTKI